MKHIVFSILIFFSLYSPAQEAGDKANHILKFDLVVDDTLLNKLDSRQYESGAKKTQTLKQANYLERHLDTLALKTLHAEFASKGMPIASNEPLRDYIKFGMDNSPLAPTLKMAIKNLNKKGYKGDTYVSVGINLGLPTIHTAPKGIKPQVELTIRRFDGQGKVQSRVQKKYKAPKVLLAEIYKDNPYLSSIIPERKTGLLAKKGEVVFDKTKKEYIELLLGELKPVLETAILEAIAELE